MDHIKNAFMQGLDAIRNTAALKQGVVSVGDIIRAFPGMELQEEQIALIYEFLDREGISLADYEPQEEALDFKELAEETWGMAESESEQRLYDIYQEELARIRPISAEEESQLTDALLSTEEERRRSAAERLTEGNLRWVIQIAREHSGRGVPLPDLIQEGNMALWEAISLYRGEEELSRSLEKSIREALRRLIREVGHFGKTEEDMASLANRILETVSALEEETGEAVEAAEIARVTGIPLARVEAVLRESARAIKNKEH